MRRKRENKVRVKNINMTRIQNKNIDTNRVNFETNEKAHDEVNGPYNILYDKIDKSCEGTQHKLNGLQGDILNKINSLSGSRGDME